MTKKKLLVAALSIACVAVLSIGSTLAYFSDKLDPKTNVFSMSSALTGKLEETDWNTDSGKDFKPADTIKKNPQIWNTSPSDSAKDTAPAFIGAQLGYNVGGSASTLAVLDGFADIDWNDKADAYTANARDDRTEYKGKEVEGYWIFNADHTLAYYSVPVPTGYVTEPLFTQVHIDNHAITQDMFSKGLYDGDQETAAARIMQNFDIVITGYLVQADNNDNTNGAALKDSFSSVFGSWK